MKKVIVGLLLLGAIVTFGFIETAVQVYVKIFVDLVSIQEKKTETFVDGKLVDRKIDQQEIRKESWELWVIGNVVGLPYAKFAKSVDEYPIGSEVMIFGAPLGVPFQLTRGVLGQRHLDAAEGWYDLLRYDCPQAPGSSGSGIFTKDGLLLGVVRGSYVNMFGGAYDGQHLGIAVDNIKDWLILSGYQFLFEEEGK